MIILVYCVLCWISLGIVFLDIFTDISYQKYNMASRVLAYVLVTVLAPIIVPIRVIIKIIE